jgi:hypothetical protein
VVRGSANGSFLVRLAPELSVSLQPGPAVSGPVALRQLRPISTDLMVATKDFVEVGCGPQGISEAVTK